MPCKRDPGALSAVGAESAPIVFTADSSSPAPGSWRGIQFQNTSHDATSRLEHCIIEYAGNGNVNAVHVNNAAPTLVSCEFDNNAAYDLYYQGTVGGTVTSTTFNHGIDFTGSGQVAFDANTVNWDNGFPVRLPADNVGPFAATTSFTGLDSTSAIQVTGSYLRLDATWKPSIPYALTSSLYIQGTDGADSITTLTIEPGAEVRLGTSYYLYVGASSGDPGALAAQGTATAPIRFTANSLTPTAGFWSSIRFSNTADDDLSKLEHCTVEYGGHGNSAQVYIDRSTPAIRYSTIRNSENYGIQVASGDSSGTIIECNNIKDNQTGVYVFSNAQPVISGNNFINNQN